MANHDEDCCYVEIECKMITYFDVKDGDKKFTIKVLGISSYITRYNCVIVNL